MAELFLKASDEDKALLPTLVVLLFAAADLSYEPVGSCSCGLHRIWLCLFFIDLMSDFVFSVS
jgi:hypothetical protein